MVLVPGVFIFREGDAAGVGGLLPLLRIGVRGLNGGY